MIKEILLNALLATSFALSEKQRDAIRKRDGNRCAFPIPHRCEGRIEVHHVHPQGWEKERLGFTEEQRDVPENLLSICQSAHHLIHPDEKEFIARYTYDKKEARPVIDNRRESLCKQGIRYWFGIYDDELADRATSNTKKAEANGWIFPKKNGKR